MNNRRIGILTALPNVELPAVQRVFGIPSNAPPKVFDGERYWETTIDLMNGEKATVIISCSGRSGNAEIQLPTDRLIRSCHPELVAFVGIGCGLREFHKLGDVATSDLVWAYEYVKTSNKKPLDRSRAMITSKPLQTDVAFFQHEDEWHRCFSSVDTCVPDGLRPRSEPKPRLHPNIWFASGDKVMGAGELQLLNSKHNLIRVGEMEGYGVATACGARPTPVVWLIVRGISDYGDVTKDNRDPAAPVKDEYHAAAANAAASFFRTFLANTYTHPGTIPPVRVYSSDHDPEFQADLQRMLKEAREHIIICGMGLKFLKGNTEYASAIARALKSADQLKVEIIAVKSDNPGVAARVAEELKVSEELGRRYRSEWPSIYPESIEKAYYRALDVATRERFGFMRADLCPTLSVVKIDGTYLFKPFGTANVRGPESPWLVLLPGTALPLASFLEKAIEHFRRRAITGIE